VDRTQLPPLRGSHDPLPYPQGLTPLATDFHPFGVDTTLPESRKFIYSKSPSRSKTSSVARRSTEPETKRSSAEVWSPVVARPSSAPDANRSQSPCPRAASRRRPNQRPTDTRTGCPTLRADRWERGRAKQVLANRQRRTDEPVVRGRRMIEAEPVRPNLLQNGSAYGQRQDGAIGQCARRIGRRFPLLPAFDGDPSQLPTIGIQPLLAAPKVKVALALG